jgi:hypothetical protein
MPSLKLSCADAGAAKASVAVTTGNNAKARLIREKRFMIFSPDLPAVKPRRFVRAGCPGVGGTDASLGGLSGRVYGCRRLQIS